MSSDAPQRPHLLADPVFRRLWVGAGLVAITEALFLVCLTLLALDLAGPGATVGVVLAVAAVPRALLLPVGGVVADRLAPARIMVAATWLRTALLVTLAGLVVLGQSSLALVAALAGLLGVLDAAYYPASLAVLPRVVAPAKLARANALIQGFESAGDLFGPALAAGIVAAAGFGGALSTVTGLSLLAAIALAVFTRQLARTQRTPAASTTSPETAPQEGAGKPQPPGPAALWDGVRFASTEPVVRAILLILAVLNVAVIGPVIVGGAVLAEQRLGGAEQLGVVFAGFGAGSLLGLLAAGARPPTRRGWTLLLGTTAIGVGTTSLGFVTTLPTAVAGTAVIGIATAYLGVTLVAWLQHYAPEDLRGRVMSLVVVAVIAFDPLSYALAGILLPAGATIMFTTCGTIVLTAAATAAASPTLRGLT